MRVYQSARRVCLVPVDLAEIVEHRDRRRGGEIGIGDAAAGQPVRGCRPAS